MITVVFGDLDDVEDDMLLLPDEVANLLLSHGMCSETVGLGRRGRFI